MAGEQGDAFANMMVSDVKKSLFENLRGGKVSSFDDVVGEIVFQNWYRQWADKIGLDPNPDDPRHFYDYRGAFKAGVEPEISPVDNKYHWSSKFKADAHPNRFIDGMDTKTGKPIK